MESDKSDREGVEEETYYSNPEDQDEEDCLEKK